MCGIAGWFDWKKNISHQKNILEKMKESQKHRGPDESGEWISKHIGLVHRRLIVIDPEGGKQPMVKNTRNNKYVLVYNGELYNTGEIRKKLKNEGYSFKGHSDTEVVLTSYIEWGKNCVKHFNGIFAFAIWDKKKEQLYLARDRIGVKPLFYSITENGFIFASEIKGLLAHPEIKPIINEKGMAEIFAMGPGRTPGFGVFKQIKEIKPGYYLTFNKNGLEKNQYWSPVNKHHQDSLENTIEKVRNLFIDSVKRQLISDVPICTLLSGGLDSSAITSIASETLKNTKNKQLNTYSVDYEGNDKYFTRNEFQPDKDTHWIKKVSDYSNTFHHQIIISNQDLINNLKNGVRARDLPGMADIDVSLYLFCQQIKKDFTVAVSGECADEIFGGYPWFYNDKKNKTFPWMRNIDNRLNILSSPILDKIQPKSYLDWRYQQALREVPGLPEENTKTTEKRKLFYMNLTRWMPVLLDRKDRMSMYTGLEVRVPFCDHRLVEYVWNIPWEMKNYKNMRKGILREALKGILPEDVRTRPKNPYPKTFNPAYFSATKKMILNILNNPNSPLLNFINPEQIKKLTQKDSDYDIPWFGQLMKLPQLFAYLIQVNFWLKEYKVKVDI
ncbi:MAG: asparagine synthase (glutamine-hydrolyzing) [Halanaerobiales bacterium]